MKKVLVESPYKAATDSERKRNVQYGCAAMRDCFKRGEAPFASHLLYTQPGVLDDDNLSERRLGIAGGLVWGVQAELTVVYQDFGVSEGMQMGIDRADYEGRDVVYRNLPGWGVPRGKK